MHLFMYTSDYTGQFIDIPRDISHILTIARLNNPKLNITGVLFFEKGKFIQILEGEQGTLEPLISKIKQDPLHSNFTTLFNLPIAKRELEGWNMKAFNFSGEEDKNWALLEQLRDAYLENFKVSSVQIIKWLQKFIEEHDRFKHLEQ